MTASPKTSAAKPEGGVESVLAEWWQELLGVETVGLDDDFFDLGGHSLIAVRMFSKIKKTYQQDFSLSTLFEARTIRQLAGLIRKAAPSSIPGHQVDLDPAALSETRDTRQLADVTRKVETAGQYRSQDLVRPCANSAQWFSTSAFLSSRSRIEPACLWTLGKIPWARPTCVRAAISARISAAYS